MLKAITLWEPWASLMAIGAKTNETRGVRTSHRGDIAIHAAVTDHGVPEHLWQPVIDAHQSRNIVPTPCFGCIVAVVDLYDVQPSELFALGTTEKAGRFILSIEEFSFGNYNAERWIYRTRNLRRLKTPVKCSGCQAIGWAVPPEIESKVRQQL